MNEQIEKSALCQTIVDETPVAILYADREGRIRLWNAGAEAMFGFTAAEAVGQSMELIIPEKQRPRHWEGWERVMKTGVTKYGRDTLAVPALRKDGTRISVEFNIVLLRTAGGEVAGAAAMMQDVTAKWQQMKELKELKQKTAFQRVPGLAAPDGHAIPAFLITPPSPRGGTVVCHGYGASKEQMLGVAVAVGEKGMAALVIDLCGHGENTAPIGPAMRDEIEAALAYARRFGPAGIIGHSLGGRLALMSSADVMVAISPSVMVQMSPQGKWMFENLPSPGVREPYSGYVIELLDKLGSVPANDRPCLLLYAERDLQALLDGADDLRAKLPLSEKRIVSEEIRPDVQHESGLIRYLPRWFNHLEVRFNRAACETAGEWLAGHIVLGSPAGATP
jgi:PAS domain S-box-containing protein